VRHAHVTSPDSRVTNPHRGNFNKSTVQANERVASFAGTRHAHPPLNEVHPPQPARTIWSPNVLLMENCAEAQPSRVAAARTVGKGPLLDMAPSLTSDHFW
jgi:hypothetical protein